MNRITALFCRHSTIEHVRAHAESSTGIAHGRMSAWTDYHKCLNLFRCTRCGKYVKVVTKESVYGTASAPVNRRDPDPTCKPIEGGYRIREFAPGIQEAP